MRHFSCLLVRKVIKPTCCAEQSRSNVTFSDSNCNRYGCRGKPLSPRSVHFIATVLAAWTRVLVLDLERQLVALRGMVYYRNEKNKILKTAFKDLLDVF